MALVVAGNNHTFYVLFVDEANQPIAVDNPTITVFTFTSAGVKQVLVDQAAMVPSTPAEVGRYTYTYAVPEATEAGTNIYAEMWASSLGVRILAEDRVAVISLSSSRSSGTGMTARFVK